MAKKILFRKQPINGGYIIERKHLNKWRGVDKYGEISDSVFFYRNEYLAQIQLNNFEQRTEILPSDIIAGDTELQVDNESGTEV
jgi:hypothetical protein